MPLDYTDTNNLFDLTVYPLPKTVAHCAHWGRYYDFSIVVAYTGKVYSDIVEEATPYTSESASALDGVISALRRFGKLTVKHEEQHAALLRPGAVGSQLRHLYRFRLRHLCQLYGIKLTDRQETKVLKRVWTDPTKAAKK